MSNLGSIENVIADIEAKVTVNAPNKANTGLRVQECLKNIADTLNGIVEASVQQVNYMPVVQVDHGLTIGTPVRIDPVNGYVPATADTIENSAVIGIVHSVTDANNFSVAMPGGLAPGFTGLTTGQILYLQDSGGLGPTRGQVELPIAVAMNATTVMYIGTLPLSEGAVDLRTGTAVSFDAAAQYNTAESPSAGSVTVDFTGAVQGTEVLMWLNHASTPIWPSGFTVVGVWNNSQPNAVRLVYSGGTTVSGTIVSSANGSYTNPTVYLFPNVANVPQDTSASTTTPVTISGLSFVAKAGKEYAIRFVTRGASTAASIVRIGVYYSAGTGQQQSLFGRQDANTNAGWTLSNVSGFNAQGTQIWPTTGINRAWTEGTIRGGTVDCVVDLRLSSNTNGQTATIHSLGTYMMVTQMN